MSIVKVRELAHVRFRAPELDRMRAFLQDFGLVDADAGADTLYMRGRGAAPAIHVTERGAACFAGLAFRADDIADLAPLAAASGAAITAATGPGGGWRVRLTDPDDFAIDVIAGQADVPPLPVPAAAPWNLAAAQARTGIPRRVAPGPSNVIRLGHVVLLVSDLQASWAWYREHFGLIVSDEVRAPDGSLVALFLRCDRGETPTDHHVLNLAQARDGVAAFHHAAFEVADLDDLMIGSTRLAASGYRHVWGVGRHILGSQVFDYWRDPWGHMVEHWTDGDLFSADHPAVITDLAAMTGLQWGPAMPADFV